MTTRTHRATRIERWITASLIVCALALPATAHADVKATDGAPGTAQTLPRGARAVGLILHPAAYGVTDRIQIGSYLLPLVVAMPNVEIKARLIDGPQFDLTARSSYLHSFMFASVGELSGELIGAVSNRRGGSFGVKAGGARSFVFGDGRTDFGFFSLSAEPVTSISVGAYGELPLTRNDVLYASVDFRQALTEATNVTVNGLDADDLRWDARLMYAHAWQNFRLGAGLIHNRSMLDNRDPDDPRDDDGEPPAVPVYPMVDLWWRFN